MEKKERAKNLILRGVPEVNNKNVTEKCNFIEVVDKLGIKKLSLEEIIVFVKRLGGEPGKRPLKVEFETFNQKRALVAWRKHFADGGITISNDYSEDERAHYALNKKIAEELKKKYGIIAKIQGKLFEIRNKKYNKEEIQVYMQELEEQVGGSQSSPEMVKNGKRLKLNHAKRDQKKETQHSKPHRTARRRVLRPRQCRWQNNMKHALFSGTSMG